MRRVVVTGLGAISPLAANLDNSWQMLCNGESGIGNIASFDADNMPCKIAGHVPRIAQGDNIDDKISFNPNLYIPAKEQRKIDSFIIFAIAAAAQAIEDSGIAGSIDSENDYAVKVNLSDKQSERAGVMIGSGIGGLPMIEQTAITLHEKGPKRVSPFFIPASLINLAAGQVAIKYGFKGPNHATVTACSSGAHAIGDAAAIIARGDADIMVSGGAEAAICPIGIAGFSAARALSTKYNDTPKQASRPWDKGRDGFVMGEGAGIIVLEEYEHAKARGANIYAELVGYGMSGDAYHITAPSEDGDGAYRAMKMAVNNAARDFNVDLQGIDYINAHGTSTPRGDIIEINAIRKLFGSDCEKLAISSTKSSVGHLLGAAGAIETVFSIKAMNSGIIPPTLNLEEPDDEVLGLNLVPLKAQEKHMNIVMSNSFGFGGTNSSLIFKKI